MYSQFPSSTYSGEEFPPKPHGLFVVVALPVTSSKIRLLKALSGLDWLATNNPQFFNNALNSFNLQKTIERLERERAAKFFTAENLDRVGRRYNRPNFAQELKDFVNHPEKYQGPAGEREKLKLMQFLSDRYNDHIGAPRTTIKLFNGEPNLHGYFKPGSGDGTIYINRNSPHFTKDPAQLINTIVHENTHNLQDHPNRFSDPRLSRIYRANFQAYANAKTHGYEAYRNQPVEVGAHAAGETAEKLVRQLAATGNDISPPRGDFRPVSRPIRGYRLAA